MAHHNFLHKKIPYLHALQGNGEMGARYLDPKYSRWISTDPALGKYVAGKSNSSSGGIYNPTNLNLYHYGNNNPIKYLDPDGRETIPLLSQKFGDYDYIPRIESIDTGNQYVDEFLGGLAFWWNLFAGCGAVITNGIGAGFELIDSGISKLDENWPRELSLTGNGIEADLEMLTFIYMPNPQLASDILSQLKSAASYLNATAGNSSSSIPNASTEVNGCFVAGTLVSSKQGLIPIEKITAGDYVYAYNEESSDVELQKVIKTFVHQEKELLIIHLEDSEMITTKIHPFWTKEKGWISAGDLEEGDIIRTKSNSYLTVFSIETKLLNKPVFVYNIEVENAHTYFVGEEEILVHNKAAKNTYRPKTRGANANDRQMIENVAKKHGVDRRGFGDFIEDIKKENGMGASETFNYKDLEKYAEAFKEYGGGR